MCGSHDLTGAPSAHRHHHMNGRPVRRLRSRRAFIGEFGRGAIAFAVFTPLVAACSSDDGGTATQATGSSDGGDADTTSSETTAGTAETTSTAAPSTAAGDGSAGETVRWARANLGFVSAYVLARGNTAAIVDTGAADSAVAIGETLQTLGLTYDDVDHVILTHKHGDHIGSLTEVMAAAASATVYAGEADLDDIDAEGITGLVGGEDVFGFEMLATPGHTPGHMAAIDHSAGLLVAGDAIFSGGGEALEGPERFFDDVFESRDTIRQLATLSFNTLLVGHGDPIEGGADAAVAELAASL